MSQDIRKENLNLLEQYDNNYRRYQSFVSEMEHLVRNIICRYQITCNAIVSRLKSRESLAEKIERKQGQYADISDITDIAGVRIITYYSEDVDQIAQIIEKEFDVDQENSIDKREAMEPDKFGYCSVHYIVSMNAHRLTLSEYQSFQGLKCEIQIRSVLQHAWAEIEHDIGYKSEITIPKEMRRSFSRIAGLLEIADKEFNNIRKELVDYRNMTQKQVEDDDYIEREIDAVVLEVMLELDPNIQRLNKHIETLTGRVIDNSLNTSYYEMTLRQLRWFGIRTVRQVADINSKYTDIALKIADEILKASSKSVNANNLPSTIAFFYLCYAILIVEKGKKELIKRYLIDNSIGTDDTLEQTTQKLYDIAMQLNNMSK